MLQGGGNWLNTGFGGYWFTIVLFQMWSIYLGLSIASQLIKHDITIPILVVLSIVCVGIVAVKPAETWLWNFLCWENFTKYLQFFTLGIVCSKYRDRFFDILSRNWFITFVTIGWIACMMLWYNP